MSGHRFLLTLVLSLSTAACAAPTTPSVGDKSEAPDAVYVDEYDKGTTVTISQGQTLIVQLESNGSSSGFWWEMVDPDGPFGWGLQQVDTDSGGLRPTMSGLQNLVFNTNEIDPDTYEIELAYKRFWDELTDDHERFSFTVELSEAVVVEPEVVEEPEVVDEPEVVTLVMMEDEFSRWPNRHKDVTAEQGDRLVVELQQGAGTAYSWSVAEGTDEAFMAPTRLSQPTSDRPGAAVLVSFTWDTADLEVGNHRIRLEHASGVEDILHTLEVTLTLEAPTVEEPALDADPEE